MKRFAWSEAHRGGRDSFGRDTAPSMLKAVIPDPADFGPLPPGPSTPWPETIVYDHGSVYLSSTFRSACHRFGINAQPAHPDTPTDKPRVAYCTSSG